jgi:hypothetical protein
MPPRKVRKSCGPLAAADCADPVSFAALGKIEPVAPTFASTVEARGRSPCHQESGTSLTEKGNTEATAPTSVSIPETPRASCCHQEAGTSSEDEGNPRCCSLQACRTGRHSRRHQMTRYVRTCALLLLQTIDGSVAVRTRLHCAMSINAAVPMRQSMGRNPDRNKLFAGA